METKSLGIEVCDLKFAQSDGVFSGYGSVFGVVDSHKDVIAPGAYADAIKSGDDVHVFVNHGWLRGDLPVGKWSGLLEDGRGLFGSASLEMKMPSAVNAYWAMKSKLVSGLSVGFVPDQQSIERKSDGTRVIHRVKRLKEISIVTSPSNDFSRVSSVKSEELIESIACIESVRDFESLLRDAAGLTKGAAVALTARARVVFGVGEPQETQTKAMQEIADRLARLAV